MRVWVVGEVEAKTSFTNMPKCLLSWTLKGIFSTERGAADACFNENRFVALFELDEYPPKDINGWDGLYFPKANK